MLKRFTLFVMACLFVFAGFHTMRAGAVLLITNHISGWGIILGGFGMLLSGAVWILYSLLKKLNQGAST